MSTRVMVLVGFGASLAFAAAAGLLVLAALLLTPPLNARCPVAGCGREFSIPEEHRGTTAEVTRDYRCPNCGFVGKPISLYKPRPKR